MKKHYLTLWERLEMQRGVYPEQEKAIYLWFYDEDTGKVTEHEPITHYRVNNLTNKDAIIYYRDIGSSTVKNTRLDKFDRCVCDKVYSFSPNKDAAVKLIKDCLKAKLDKYEEEYKRFREAYTKFLNSNY